MPGRQRTLLGERKQQLHGSLRGAGRAGRQRQRALGHLADAQQPRRLRVQHQRAQEGERVGAGADAQQKPYRGALLGNLRARARHPVRPCMPCLALHGNAAALTSAAG